MSFTESFSDRWKDGKKIFVIIMVVNISAILLALFLPLKLVDISKETAIFAAFGIIIIVCLVGFLAFFNRLSNSPDFTKGEMRKTFAITIIMIYLLTISLVLTDQIDFFPTTDDGEKLTEQGEFNKDLLENFSYVVITVVIFYFGSRTYQQARGTKKDEDMSSRDELEKAETEVALAEAEITKVKAATTIAESELTTAEAESTKAETEVMIASKKVESAEEKILKMTDPVSKEAAKSEKVLAESEVTKAKVKEAIAKEKIEKAEKKLVETKTAETKVELKAELVFEKEKNAKKILNTKDSISKANTEAMLATMEAAKAETEAVLAKIKAETAKIKLEKEKMPEIMDVKTTSTPDIISLSPAEPIKQIQNEIISKFKKFVEQKGDAVTGLDILNFKREFTESIGELVSTRNDSINEEIKNLDPTDPEMHKRKHMLLEKKSQVTKDLAIRKVDRIHLCNTLNEIMKQDVPNLSLAKIMGEMNLTDLTAREIAQLISEGLIKPTHLGKKSFEVLQQEFFSLKNSYHPKTITEKEKDDFNIKLKTLIAEIQFLPENKQEQLYENVDKMLNP